jgi:hypothetical protein
MTAPEALAKFAHARARMMLCEYRARLHWARQQQARARSQRALQEHGWWYREACSAARMLGLQIGRLRAVHRELVEPIDYPDLEDA